MSPFGVDIWCMRQLASVSDRSALFNTLVETGLATHVLGGIWYAAAVFFLWTEAVRRRQPSTLRGLLTTLASSLLAGALSLIAGLLVAWTPPRNFPEVAPLYPDGFLPNSNTNSFPSQSTAVYLAVATGIYGVRPRLGAFLWVTTALFVALPRLYVGGHYPTDIGGGILAGLAAYLVARYWLVPWLGNHFAFILDGEASWRQVLVVLTLFLWMFELATGFQEASRLIAAFQGSSLPSR
jgi:membrane-associated phospholipid phosphatase